MTAPAPAFAAAAQSLDTSGSRQARHALTAVARTSVGRRRLIAACARDYLSQVDRDRLPRGYDRPIADDRRNRADAFRMRRGNTLARLLGLAVRPDDADLPDTARAVLAELEKPVVRLAEVAAATGQPAVVAFLHILAPAVQSPSRRLVAAGYVRRSAGSAS